MTKIELTLQQIRNSLGSLNYISKKEGLDFKFNYRIAKISESLKPIVKPYELAISKFLKENGEVDPESNQTIIKDKESLKNFEAETKSMLEEAHEISLTKIPIKMFEEYDIPAEHICNLLWMIDGEL